MMPALVNEEASVPPPAYHRVQARLGPALHINALTDASTRYICSPSAVWPCAWLITDTLLLYQPVLVARLGRTAKNPFCSLRSCAHCGGFHIRTCVTGYVIGLPLLWHAAYRWGRMAVNGGCGQMRCRFSEREKE